MTSRSKKAHAGDLNRRSHVQGKDSARKISPASDGALRFESKRSRSTDKNASDSHPTNQGDTPGETIKNRSPNRLHSKRIPQSEQSGSNLLREDLAMSGEDEDNTDAFSVASISNTLDETAHNETDFSNLEETLSDHSQQSDGDLVVTSDLVSASNMIDPNFSPFARPARKRKT